MSKRQHNVVALKLDSWRGPPDRWTTWARSLSEPHERIAARQGALIMTLALPLRMFTSINQRWEKFVLALFPRIKVSIGPILQEMAQFPSVPTAGIALTFPRVTVLENMTSPQKNAAAATGDSNRPEPKFLLQARMIFGTGSAPGRRMSHEAADFIFVNEEARSVNALRQSPLHRLFARLEGREPAVVVSRLPFAKESEMITQRMVHERLRVEQRKHADMVVRTQTISGSSEKNSRPEMEAEFASTAKERGRTWPDKLPELNVEQLTEQVIRKIDHRITAYRERLGRAF